MAPRTPWVRPRKLHRVATARGEQGVSLRRAARHLGCSIAAARALEDETRDLQISDLLRWQKILGVPLQDLLVEPDMGLSKPVMERAQLVRLMKTAASLTGTVKTNNAQRLAEQLVQQLIEIMPELEHVLAWNSVGQRRGLDEYGRTAERTLSDDLIRV